MRLILMVGVLLMLGACIDEIVIDLPVEQVQQKVIEGYVERDQNHYLLWGKISLTQNTTGDFYPVPMEGDLTIRYNDLHDIPLSSGEMVKIAVAEFHQIYGGDAAHASFQLTAEINGQKYQSEIQSILPVPKPESLSIKVESRSELSESGNVEENHYAKVLINTPLVNRENQLVSLSWTTSAAYRFKEGKRSNPNHVPKTCYANFDGFRNNISIAGVQDFPGQDALTDIQVTEALIDFRFGSLFYFTVVQKSLTESSFDYWQQVKASNERSGNIYDVFPGRIRTNISRVDGQMEQVHGFFQVSELDTIRLKVLPEMVGSPVAPCLLWMEPDMITPDDPDPCLNCLMLGNSSTVPPNYWEE